MSRKWLLACVAGAAVLAGAAWSLLPSRSPAGPPGPAPNGPPAARAETLPVSRVVLFSSGVGHFLREGAVEGDARVHLAFPVSDVNDLLKSMVLLDRDGGPVLRRSPFAGVLFNGQGRPVDLGSAANTLPATMGGNRTPIVDEAELREGRPLWVAEYHDRLLRGLPPLAAAPGRLRRLTVAEAALLQTFPAGFRFEGRQSSQYAQIGNAAPPLLAEAVARRLFRSLRGTASDP